MKRILLTTLLLTGMLFAQAQQYTKKVALVIGNSNYQHSGALPNPTNDARAMTDLLKSMGFDVTKIENANQNQMKLAINNFGAKLKNSEVGLFYYAGHGIQTKGVNYLIPIEAELSQEEQVEFDCVPVDRVLAYMEAASTKINIIIMDACRNNPFERSWSRSTAGGGLAMMNAPSGTLIAYATSPGKVASDGNSGNGLYTSALLKHMKDPGLNIEQVFKRVRTEVAEKSFGDQIPWETTSLTGDDYYFTVRQINKSNQTGTTQSSQQGGNRSSLDTETDDALEAYKKGNDYYEVKDYVRAVNYYSQAIQADPTYALAYLWRAHSYYANKQYKEAIPDYNRSIQLNPVEAQAYYYRGLSRYNTEQTNEAIDDFSLTIKYDPNYTNAYYWRGYCHYVQQNYYAAKEDYDKTISLSPDYAEVYYFRGLNYYDLKEYKNAYTDLLKLQELDPTYQQGIRLKGHTEYMLQQYDDADRSYGKFLVDNPEDADVWYWRAYANYNLGRRDLALKYVNLAIKLAPDNQTYKDFKINTLK